MLDINFIRENPEKVKKGVAAKQYSPKLVDRVLELDDKWRKLLAEVEELRQERNVVAKLKDVKRGKQIKEKLQKIEPELKKVTEEFEVALGAIPNFPLADTPVGKSEKDNVEVRKWGKLPGFDFKFLDHVKLNEKLNIFDFKSGAKVTGAGFYFLKNDGALLELALVRYGLDFLEKKGYQLFLTPDLAREKFYLGTGYLPRGPEAQTYTIADSDLGLIATAEVTLVGLHADEVLDGKSLPKKYGGYSHCFRVEAGSYGKYSKGLYRVHQFTKVEMFAFAAPADSPKIHQEFLKNEEEFWQSLEIPYRVMEMCTADLGAQAARKFDLEAWMPGRGEYGEITSTSNTTDYQARNLNIRYQMGGKTEFAHTVNGTLMATPRALIAILENYQEKDGSVVIPKVLRPYMGKEKISPR